MNNNNNMTTMVHCTRQIFVIILAYILHIECRRAREIENETAMLLFWPA